MLKWPGQALPSRRDVTVVSVISVAALRHVVADAPHVHDVVVIGLAEVIPDRGVGRHHVGLVAAVGDHVVRALRQAQMLAAEVPADVHQLHGVERALAAPGSAGGVRAFALEHVLDADQAVLLSDGPQETPRLLPTWANSTTSTSLNMPART